MDGGLIYAGWRRDKGVEIVHCHHDKSRSPGHKTNSSADYTLWRDWGWTPEMDIETVHTNWTPLRHRMHNLQVQIQRAMDVTDLTWRLVKWLYDDRRGGTGAQSGHRNEFILNVGGHADVKSNIYRYARWFYYHGGGISATYHVLLFPHVFIPKAPLRKKDLQTDSTQDTVHCTNWYDMIWYDIWYDTIRYDMIWWYDMTWHDIWYDMIWYDMIWYDMIWYDMIWYTRVIQ